ncbi:MAG: ATP-binding cassette domain-containing protein [Chloroflexi bacterium]|nr:ATP-binding cassette domain-containing protein [Chloroflexota bacterium]
MPLLQVESLTKRFYIDHLKREIAVFADVTFTLEKGHFMLVGGANGAGKSSLLRCLFRSYIPTSGRALFAAKQGMIDLARAADVDIALLRREELGFVTQFLRPRPRVSALELVAEPLVNGGTDWDTAQEQARGMLASFGLKVELWAAYPTTFSGGEQQKVNLARALIAPRRLLLLDEPTASLDAATRQSLQSRLAELKGQGVAMIGVFHHPEDILHLIDDEIHLTSTHEEVEHVAD